MNDKVSPGRPRFGASRRRAGCSVLNAGARRAHGLRAVEKAGRAGGCDGPGRACRAVHKAAPQGADAHGGCRTRCALRRHAAPRGALKAAPGAAPGAASRQLSRSCMRSWARRGRLSGVSLPSACGTDGQSANRQTAHSTSRKNSMRKRISPPPFPKLKTTKTKLFTQYNILV